MAKPKHEEDYFLISVSLYKTDLDKLSKIQEELGLSRSATIRELVKKFKINKKRGKKL